MAALRDDEREERTEEEREMLRSEESASRIPFRVVSDVLERLEAMNNEKRSGKGKGKQRKRLSAIDVVLSEELAERIGKNSLYPYLRLLLPDIDSQRATYNIQDKRLARYYADVIGLDQNSEAYTSLKNFTDCEKNTVGVYGDFASTLFNVLKARFSNKASDHTVGQVNKLLDDLAGAVDDAGKKNVLKVLGATYSPTEQKWIARVILKNLRISSLTRKQVFRRLHPDAEDIYDKTSNLRRVCSEVAGRHSQDRIATNLEPLKKFLPMLALRLNFSEILSKLENQPFVMEVKFDGERFICHKQGKSIKWFTRQGTDYSDKYGPVLDDYVLENVSVENCILDGEVLGWDEEKNKFVPFGFNQAVATEEKDAVSSGAESKRKLLYVAFDILFASGEGAENILEVASKMNRLGLRGTIFQGSLTGYPLEVRRCALRYALVPQAHRIEIAEHQEVWDVSAEERQKKLHDYFQEIAIERHEEGLVIKRLDSRYVPGEGSRKLGLWIKMKPDYGDATAELDLVVLGGYFGDTLQPGRAGQMTSFLCGIRKSGSEEKQAEPLVLPCGKVGSGVSADIGRFITELIKEKGENCDEKKGGLPSWVQGPCGRARDWPDRWIHPSFSVIMTVKAYQLVDTDDWASGFSMRFPRLIKLRDRSDKIWKDADDEQAAAEIKAASRKDLASRKEGSSEMPFVKKAASSSAKRVKIAVASAFQVNADATDTVAERRIFCDNNGTPITMCVIGDQTRKFRTSSGDYYDPERIRGIILRNGGKVVPTAKETTTQFVITGTTNEDERCSYFQAKSIIKQGKMDVVDVEWILNCDRNGTFCLPHWTDYLSMSERTKIFFKQYYDDYGDHFTEPVTDEQLRKMLKYMTPPAASSGEKLDWQDEALCWSEDEQAIFDGVPGMTFWRERGTMYVDIYANPASENPEDREKRVEYSSLIGTKFKIEFHRGKVASTISTKVTHIIMDPEDLDRQSDIRKVLRAIYDPQGRRWHVRVVSPEWVDMCIEQGRVLEPLPEQLVALR